MTADPSGETLLSTRPYLKLSPFVNWLHTTVDQDKLDPILGRIEARRMDGSRLEWAKQAILRASAFETGAVENMYPSTRGATISVAYESPEWRESLKGDSFDATGHFEDQMRSYERAREYASSTDKAPLSEALLRSFHETVTYSQSHHTVQTQHGPQEHAMPHGKYKTTENHVVDRAGQIKQYCPANEVPAEMNELIRATRTDSFENAHSIVRAAYLHWAIVHVHPFADGNGRLARVISSIPLLEAFGIPLLVFADRKAGYIQALEAADYGHPQDLVAYFLHRTLDTLLWLVELVESESADSVLDDVQRIEALVLSLSAPIESPKEAAERLNLDLRKMVQEEVNRVLGDSPVHRAVEQGYGGVFGGGYWLVETYEAVEMTLSLDAPVQANHTETAIVGYTTELGVSHALQVFASNVSSVLLALEDCSPNLSVGADARLKNFVRTLVANAVREFELELASILRMHGSLPARDTAPE